MFIVMSAERAEKSASVNLRHTFALVDLVERMGFEYQVGVGRYSGTPENCVLIGVPAHRYDDAITMAMSLMKRYSQECILLVDDQRNGRLIFPDGMSTPIGEWRQITSEEAATIDHTEINGEFFACINEDEDNEGNEGRSVCAEAVHSSGNRLPEHGRDTFVDRYAEWLAAGQHQ